MTLSGRRGLRLGLLRTLGALRGRPRAPGRISRILVIRPDHLGDAIMAAPALTELREAFPDSAITAWVGAAGQAAWQGHPALDSLMLAEFPGMTRRPSGALLGPYALAVREARRLAGRFDVALNLRFDYWWGAMTAYLAGIPTAGYDLPEGRPFLWLPVPYRPSRHEVDQNRTLVAALQRAWAGQPPREVEGPEAVETAWGLAVERPPIDLAGDAAAIHPGAGARVKLWDEASWARVADALAGSHSILITAGSEEERAEAERIRGMMQAPARVVHGLSVSQLAGLYQRCQLVLGTDNGPIHLAEAVGTPTVALFGPVDPRKFGPYGGESDLHRVVRLAWPCVPCGRLDYTQEELTWHPCVRLINPEQVIRAARETLAARSHSSPSPARGTVQR